MFNYLSRASREVALAFFETLNFSSANEDGASELAALAQARRILCLTGSGTRPLDLLSGQAEAVIALDANPVQNALLALKMAAIANLERADCLAFLGISDGEDRLGRYQALRPTLSPEARAFWDRRPGMIRRGVWYAGQWERLLGWNARLLRLRRGRAVAALMASPDLAAQETIWRERFMSGPLARRLENAARDLVWRLVMREPAAAFLPSAREVGDYLEERFARAARSFLFRASDCAALALMGRHSADGALPVHLRAEHYNTVRQNLPRLRLVEAELADLAGMELGEIDGFSLSDFGSYCGADDYAACWNGVLAQAAPGAQFCERIFMNEMAPPAPRVVIDEPLSSRLSASDTAIIYRIRAGTIAPAA